MPAGAPIGSGLGMQNEINISLIVEQSKVPVLVDAGVGTASDATRAMELGCDAVMTNTAIAAARDPIRMAVAMKHAVIAGREKLSGRPHAQEAVRRPELTPGGADLGFTPHGGRSHTSPVIPRLVRGTHELKWLSALKAACRRV